MPVRERQRSITEPSNPTRIFSPEQLDLDDLAEAIRMLLNDERPERANLKANPGLLSPATRVTHVLGEETP